MIIRRIQIKEELKRSNERIRTTDIGNNSNSTRT
jgi:hypothetical protein